MASARLSIELGGLIVCGGHKCTSGRACLYVCVFACVSTAVCMDV